MLVLVMMFALLAVGVVGLLWLGARSSVDDAVTERDIALAERDAANAANVDAGTQLRAAQDELDDARAALDGASAPPSGTDQSTPDELHALQDEVDELAGQVGLLEDENETLAGDLADAEEAAALAESAPSTNIVDPGASSTTLPDATLPPTSIPPTTAPATTRVPAATVVEPAPSMSPDEIGGQVAGLFRRSVLGDGQKSCLGQVLVNDFGEERVLAAIASESPRDDLEFVDAIRAAARFCNIDPSAILG